MTIHSTAIIDKDVELDPSVKVGAYSVIKGKVKIGSGTVIKEHVVIYGPASIGCNNTIYPGAVVGGEPQDLKYKGEETDLIIGDGNTIRECVTIHRGTTHKHKTVIGNNNLIMAYCHIAHDCILGDNIVLTNSVQLGGHVVLEDHVTIGGMSGIHQYTTVGRFAFLGGASAAFKDVPPFMIVKGVPAAVTKVNTIGLERNNFDEKSIKLLKKAHRLLFKKPKDFADNLALLKKGKFKKNESVQHLVLWAEATANSKTGRVLEEK